MLYLRALSKYKPPGAYIRRGDLTEGFLRYEFEGLVHGGAYFRNFTVSLGCLGLGESNIGSSISDISLNLLQRKKRKIRKWNRLCANNTVRN